ncbi:MAG: InlB B-repeat-containing protein, partial [Ruminococcus sp.]|nr:InlB B-repeat-containing protein [Ruminococcus sp.]
RDVWYGNTGEIDDTTLTTSSVGWEMIAGEGDCALVASGGKYTFNFNLETKFLEVLYTPVEYTVTFISTADEVVSKQLVRYGAAAVAPEAPALEGYNFIKWDTDFTNIESDTTVKAIYAPSDAEFTVEFVDWNGAVLSTHTVKYGGFAMPPQTPERPGYQFIGWDKNFTYVTSDLTVTARYMATTVYLSGEFNNWNEEVAMAATDDSAIVTYEITLPKGEYEFKIIAYDVWYGNEGTIEDTTVTTSEMGWAMLGYKGNCTLKASGGKYTFIFYKNTAMLEVLYAPVKYEVTFIGLNGQEISKQMINLGDGAKAPEPPAEEGYKFVEWDTEFGNITADLTVTAKYKKIGASGAGSGYNGYNGGMAGTGSIVAKGLDLSAWQEDNVNFEAFKAEGYSFVILRAGTSKGKDKYFETYYTQAKAAGLYVGAYYYTYATTVSSAEADAKHFLNCIAGKSFEYPIYLDYETSDQWSLPASTSTAICQKFMGILENKGYLVGMYTGAYNFRESWVTDSGIRDYYEGWVAHYASTSSDAGYSKYGSTYSTQYGIYQFTDKHYITHNGVKYGPYDANVAYKDYPSIVAAYGFNNYNGSTDVTPVEKYNVRFVDYNGAILSEQEVEYGEAAIAPENPTREGYIFIGWDKKFDVITGKTTINALYKDNKVYLAGSFNDWKKDFYLEREGDSSVFSTKIVFLEGTHYFKLVQGDTWYSNASTVIDTTDKTSKDGIELRPDNDLGEIILNASGGTYTFRFDVATDKLTVLYSEEYISYNVTFVNYDGTVLSEQEVYINNSAVAPADPTRPGDENNSYKFNGWDVDFSRVTSDMTVTATYLLQLPIFTVTFVDTDGTVLSTVEVEKGLSATAPVLEAREGKLFLGWDTDFSNVTSDLTVTAVFIDEGEGEASNISIAGTFNEWNSSATYFNMTSNDDIVVTQMELTANTYEFKVVNDGNWFGCDTTIVNTTAGGSLTMSNSAGNCKLAASGGTYTFIYYKSTNKLVVNFESDGGEIILYTVTFADTDGSVIAKQSVLAGGSATAPAAPEKEGYVFAGWDKDFSKVTEDITVTAKYVVGSYSNVSIAGEFNGWNQNANIFIKKSGSNVVTLELNLAKGVYKFKVVDGGNWLGNNGVIVDKTDAGWGMDGAAGDCVLAASGGTYILEYNTSKQTLKVSFDGVSNIELPTYTVTFNDWNGTVIDTQQVKLGASAIAPPNPVRGGHSFGGWDGDFGCIKGDATFTAWYIDNGVYLMGINGNWDPGLRMSYVSGSTYQTSVKLGAGQYGFKIRHGNNWYGNNGWIEDTTDYTSESGWEMSTDTGDCVLNAIGSTYTFTFNTRTRMLKITYVAPTYAVTFKNFDGTVLSSQVVKRGDAAKAPKVPEREGKIFIGWDRDYSWIYEDMIVTAMFAEDNITLMGDFNSWNGTKMTHFHDTVFMATLELKKGSYGFKTKIAESWLGNSGTIEDTTTSTSDVGWEMSASVGDNCTLKASGGTYVFIFDVNSKMLIILKAPDGYSTSVALAGDFNKWAETEMIKDGETTVYTTEVQLEKGMYKFKVRNGLSMLGYNGTIEDTTASMDEAPVMSEDAVECILMVTTGGLYRFIYDTQTNILLVGCDVATGDEASPDEATIDEIHKLTFNESDTFTIVSDADMNAIMHGDSFSFTVEVAEGYLLNAVVYDMKILTATDGVFTIENITADAPVIVVVIKDEVSVKPMEFTVVFADKDGNTIDTQVVAYGNAAIAPEAPAVEGYTFTGWDTEFDFITMDVIVKATYKKIPAPIVPATTGKLVIETSGGKGFTISVNGGNARPQGAAYTNTQMPIGAKVTLVAPAVNGATFLGWVNEAGGIESTTETYTFNTTGNDYIKAVYQTVVAGVNVVTFKNDKAKSGNGQIVDMQYYAAGDEILFPVTPSQPGYDFKGWSMTAEQIQAELAAGRDVTVVAIWERAKVYVDVAVNGGTIITSAQPNGKYLAYGAVTVKADSAEIGKKFAYWTDADGNILSYSVEYKFYPAANTELTAVFVPEDETVVKKALVSMAGDPTTTGEKITYTVSWEIDASVGTITNYGLVIVDAADYNEDTFYHGSGDSKIFDRASKATTVVGVKSMSISGRTYDHTYYAKAFIIYTDAVTGETVTVYSDMIETYKPAP